MAESNARPSSVAKGPRGRRPGDVAESKARQRLEVLTDRARHAVVASEEEPRWLVAELHDGAGTKLAIVKLNLSSLARAIPAGAPEAATLLLETQGRPTDTILGICDTLQRASSRRV